MHFDAGQELLENIAVALAIGDIVPGGERIPEYENTARTPVGAFELAIVAETQGVGAQQITAVFGCHTSLEMGHETIADVRIVGELAIHQCSVPSPRRRCNLCSRRSRNWA